MAGMSGLPTTPPVPHPGPRPGDLTFPVAEARAALAAIEDELDDLAGVARDHDAAAVEVCQGFEGRSRVAFETWLGDCLSRLATRRQQLAGDAESLRRWLAEAERLRAQREAQQRAWADRQRAYAADQDARRRAAQLR
jgi:hypothetical protein